MGKWKGEAQNDIMKKCLVQSEERLDSGIKQLTKSPWK